MTLPAAAEFMGNRHIAGENQLAFDLLDLKACCVKRVINEWEDYILVPMEINAVAGARTSTLK